MSTAKRLCGWLVLGMGIGVLMVGCATVRVPVQVTHPAEINMSKYKQVAISNIDGNLGNAFADDLKGRLVESGRFALVDRARLDQIMREQHLSSSDLVQGDKAAKLGNILPATAIISGRTNGKYDEKTTQSAGRCYRGKDDKNGYRCVTYYRNGVFSTGGSIDVIDVSTAQIMKSKALGNRCEASTSATDGTPDSIDRDSLAADCLNKNVTKFMKAISPWTEIVQAPFRKDGALPALEAGVNQAKIGDMQGAVETFQTAAKSAEMNPKISPKIIAMAYWDMGLAYQYSDDFDKGIAAFKKSCVLDPSDECMRAIKNCETHRKEKRMLDEQNK